MILRRIKIVILFLVAFLLQGNIVHLLSIKGGVPELLLVLTVSYTFLEDSPVLARDGLIVGLAAGLLKDLCYAQITGISSLLYLTVGLLMIYFKRRLNNKSIVILAFVMILSTGIYGMGQWLLCTLFTQSVTGLSGALWSLPGGLFWNMAVSLIIFRIRQKRNRSRFHY